MLAYRESGSRRNNAIHQKVLKRSSAYGGSRSVSGSLAADWRRTGPGAIGGQRDGIRPGDRSVRRFGRRCGDPVDRCSYQRRAPHCDQRSRPLRLCQPSAGCLRPDGVEGRLRASQAECAEGRRRIGADTQCSSSGGRYRNHGGSESGNAWTVAFYCSALIYAAGALCWKFIDPVTPLDLERRYER